MEIWINFKWFYILTSKFHLFFTYRLLTSIDNDGTSNVADLHGEYQTSPLVRFTLICKLFYTSKRSKQFNQTEEIVWTEKLRRKFYFVLLCFVYLLCCFPLNRVTYVTLDLLLDCYRIYNWNICNKQEAIQQQWHPRRYQTHSVYVYTFQLKCVVEWTW